MGKTVTKADLVDQVAKDSDLSKAKAAQAVNSLIENIIKAVSKNTNVTLVGFGTFTSMQRKARTGRNPQTGKAINIEARKVPKFRPGKGLKDAVAKKKK